MKEMILGYKVDTCSLVNCVDEVLKDIENTKTAKWLACLNPHSFVMSLKDYQFAIALKDADWLIPDGVGIVIASKVLGGRINKRVCGPDVFGLLMDKFNTGKQVRIFFMGSTENTLMGIRKRIDRDYPGITVAGTYSPPFAPTFSDSENADMLLAINNSNADILWIGLTAPKQEKWIFENKHRIKVRFIGAVGAMFDYFAEINRLPPLFIQRFGMQWLHRLIQQPRRMWKRTFVSSPIFFSHVLRAWMNKYLLKKHE